MPLGLAVYSIDKTSKSTKCVLFTFSFSVVFYIFFIFVFICEIIIVFNDVCI